jgi:HK97 family phage prohead protease/HK97 family phage major capsid protein
MTITAKDLTVGLQRRDHEARADVDEDGRTLTAIGVPYNVEIDLGYGFREMFAPGSVEDDGAILRYGHRDPLGVITTATDTDAGRQISGRVSATRQGDDVMVLLRDGVLTRMSIGFEPIEHTETDREDGTTLITWTKVRAREYSVVEFPAYEDAEILDVRHHTPAPVKETPTMDTDKLTDDVADLRRDLDNARAALAELRDGHAPAPTPDRRSAGEFLRALVVEHDEAARAAAEHLQARAFTGTTSDADPRVNDPTWVADLYRLIDTANPLAALFASGSLPSEGNSIEFGRIKTNTLQVAVQAAEGDDLVMGKLDTETSTAAIKTYGGYTSLSVQAIERTRANILDLHLRGMALAAGVAAANAFNTFYEGVVAGQSANALSSTKTADALAWADINGLIIDAAHAYSDIALPLDGLIVDPATFKAITSLTDTSGRPLFTVTGQGVNAVGTANPKAISADVAGLALRPNYHQTSAVGEGVVGAFYSSEALRTYKSNPVRLQDSNIINLSQSFSVYFYAAFADEIPGAIVPLTLGAGA